MLQIASFSIIGVKRLDSFCYAATFYLGVHCEPRRLVCHAICMSIVLSHNTAKAVYQAAYSVSAIGTEPCSPAKIYGARPSKELLDSAADWLARHNVALDNDAPLDTTVFERANVRSMTGCKCHDVQADIGPFFAPYNAALQPPMSSRRITKNFICACSSQIAHFC